MKAVRVNINQDWIQAATRNGEKKLALVIAEAKRAKEDLESAQREQQSLCRSCYYLSAGKIVMHAFHNRQCAFCDTNMAFANSDTAVTCGPCADKRDLCRQCGGLRNP